MSTSLPSDNSRTALQPYELEPNLLYSIEITARLAHVSRRRIAVYCREGLISPVKDVALGNWQFNGAAIRTLRCIETMRVDCGMNPIAIRMIVELMREVEQLQQKIRFMRSG